MTESILTWAEYKALAEAKGAEALAIARQAWPDALDATIGLRHRDPVWSRERAPRPSGKEVA